MKIITITVEDDVQPAVFKALADAQLTLIGFTITTPKPPRVRTKKGEEAKGNNR